MKALSLSIEWRSHDKVVRISSFLLIVIPIELRISFIAFGQDQPSQPAIHPLRVNCLSINNKLSLHRSSLVICSILAWCLNDLLQAKCIRYVLYYGSKYISINPTNHPSIDRLFGVEKLFSFKETCLLRYDLIPKYNRNNINTHFITIILYRVHLKLLNCYHPSMSTFYALILIQTTHLSILSILLVSDESNVQGVRGAGGRIPFWRIHLRRLQGTSVTCFTFSTFY